MKVTSNSNILRGKKAKVTEVFEGADFATIVEERRTGGRAAEASERRYRFPCVVILSSLSISVRELG